MNALNLFFLCFVCIWIECICLGSNDLVSKLQQVAGVYEDPNLVKALNLEKTVLITACNHGFINHLFNFQCFAKRLGMKFLVIAMDKQTEDTLQATNIVAHYINDTTTGDITSSSTEFRSKQFNVITARKKEAVHIILKLGYDVIFSDTDVAMVQDPLPFMIWQNIDYVHSLNLACDMNRWDTFFSSQKLEGNTGFYYVRSNEKTIKLWADAFAAAPKYPRLDDQAIFWKIIRKSQDPPIKHLGYCNEISKDLMVEKNYLTSCMLSTCAFSSGMISDRYVPELTYGRLVENLAIKREPLITLHANYVTGNQKKANKMKKYGLWLADIQENGSFTCRPYVPYVWTNETLSE